MSNWPLIKEFRFLLQLIVEFVFNQLSRLDIKSAIVGIFFISFFFQLIYLPFSQKKLRRKKVHPRDQLKQLAAEYKDKINDPESRKEYMNKRAKIMGRANLNRWIWLLNFILQIFVIGCMLTTLRDIPNTIDMFAQMDEAGLKAAYNLFGIDTRTSVMEVYWPNIALVLVYVPAFYVPNMIKNSKREKKEFEAWYNSLSEEERRMADEEGAGKSKKISPRKILGSLVSPAFTIFFGIKVYSFIVFYWLCNVIWRAAFHYSYVLVVEKLWPKVRPMLKKGRADVAREV